MDKFLEKITHEHNDKGTENMITQISNNKVDSVINNFSTN